MMGIKKILTIAFHLISMYFILQLIIIWTVTPGTTNITLGLIVVVARVVIGVADGREHIKLFYIVL